MDTQGRRIKKLRLAKGLSQKRLSDMLELYLPTYRPTNTEHATQKKKFSIGWQKH